MLTILEIQDDFIPAVERGFAIGGAAGLFIGLLALVFPPAGLVVGGGGIEPPAPLISE